MNQTLIKDTCWNNRHFNVLEHVINVSHEVFVGYLSSLSSSISSSINPMNTKVVRNYIESINFESTLNTIESLSFRSNRLISTYILWYKMICIYTIEQGNDGLSLIAGKLTNRRKYGRDSKDRNILLKDRYVKVC